MEMTVAIPVGVELDAEVARVIFKREVALRYCTRDPECGGWDEIESIYDSPEDGFSPDLLPLVGEKRFCLKEDGGQWEPVPEYSTRILPALRVFMAMTDRMWSLTWLPEMKVWQGVFIDTSPLDSQLDAPSLAEVICRMALRAVGG